MTNYLTRAPHADPTKGSFTAPNAALLIDFDNVTMGMRSDLAKELKSLLDSDIIKGKVTVQRAYADWRRYPQYIVPLSEASIDLIFAPAYGSSKKNATDIRMAIDGMELVFIRPEIGTYILLTGDSDFSSLVLKLKEYGKYVIGIGIQESSSDILVQNCDEYYSYTALSGLRKTTDLDARPLDPWECVSEAVKRMVDRGDVMRSDRLKQVMLELSPDFDERNLGFRKFSKFLVEAAGKGLLSLERGENGQYEVGVPKAGAAGGAGNGRSRGGRGRGRSSTNDQPKAEGGSRGGDRGRSVEKNDKREGSDGSRASKPDMRAALTLLEKAVGALVGDGRDQVMDSDVKRRMLTLDRAFDESSFGFSKFSQFLTHAEEQGTVSLRKTDTGNYEVSAGAAGSQGAAAPSEVEAVSPGDGGAQPAGRRAMPTPEPPATEAPSVPESASPPEPEESRGVLGLRGLLGRLGPRRGERSRGRPPLEEVQIAPEQTRVPPSQQQPAAPRSDVGADSRPPVPDPPAGRSPLPEPDSGPRASTPPGTEVDAKDLGLPTTSDSMISYLANRYRGVGQKTAETLVEALGTDLFNVLQNQPDRIQGLVGESRAEQVLTAWREDYGRRMERAASRASVG
ncbi:MAG: NYN domain-containing protein [Gemmatimonadota bacterium]|nr:NYN domain-containing protein [Gemmatimonadota bacterium]